MRRVHNFVLENDEVVVLCVGSPAPIPPSEARNLRLLALDGCVFELQFNRSNVGVSVSLCELATRSTRARVQLGG